jgi:hypothetical protein
MTGTASSGLANARLILCLTFLSAAVFFASCGHKNGDSSQDGFDAGSDGNNDDGTDSDEDDAGSDTDTGTFITDAGPWDWEDQPDGEDCGPGCAQLTFGTEFRFREWDIWDKQLVFSSVSREKDRAIYVVNWAERKQLKVPNVHPQHPIETFASAAFSPAISRETVIYVLSIYDSIPRRHELVRLDLKNRIQEVFWSRRNPNDSDSTLYELPDELDVFNLRLVSRAACGNPQVRNLCAFEFPVSASGAQTLIDHDYYGKYNTLWEDRLVFLDIRDDVWNINSYDFTKREFIPVTNDSEIQHLPRVQGNRVAYLDFRLSEGGPVGSWAGVVVFVKDLTTGQTVQVNQPGAVVGYPDIFGETVVWQDYRHCDDPYDKEDFENVEIYGYNLKTNKEFRVTNLPGRPKQTPRIWGDKVFVDMHKKDGGNAIYMFDLPAGQK